MSWRDEPVAVAVASHGLAEAAVEWPRQPLEAAPWERLLRIVDRQRLTGLLAGAVGDERLPVTPEQRAEVSERHREAMIGVLEREALLIDAAVELDGAGVPWRVLKGSASAHLDYDDPALRVFGDVDALVPGERVLDAVEALAAVGARRQRPPLGHGFDARFAKSVELADEQGRQIDLHRTLALEPFGLRIDESDLFVPGATFTVGGRSLPALGVEERFLLACYHASLGNYPVRLVPLRDLAGIALGGQLDPARTVALAERWWARAVTADAVGTAWRLFGLPDASPLAEWATSYRPSRGERLAMDAFQRRDRRQAHRTVATLRTLPGLSRRAAYLSALLRPDPAYLESRGLGRGQWLRRARAALPGGTRR